MNHTHTVDTHERERRLTVSFRINDPSGELTDDVVAMRIWETFDGVQNPITISVHEEIDITVGAAK